MQFKAYSRVFTFPVPYIVVKLIVTLFNQRWTCRRIILYNGMLPKDGAIAPKHVGVFYRLRSEVYVHLVG
jgi:hypothetical protein